MRAARRREVMRHATISGVSGPGFRARADGVLFFFFFITLGLEMSDTQVYEP